MLRYCVLPPVHFGQDLVYSGITFSACFTGFLRLRTVRKILDIFEVFLGVFEKTKEKKDRVFSRFWGFLTPVWSAANGGLRDGGLSNSEDVSGKRPFPPFSGFSRCSSGPPEKGEKGRKREKKADFGRFPGQEARHPLNPHLLHSHLRHSNL